MKFIRMILPALFLTLLVAGCGDDGGTEPTVIADRFVGNWTVSRATSNGNDVTSSFSGVSINFTKSGDTNGAYTAQVSGSLLAFIGGNGTWSTTASGTTLTIRGNTYNVTVTDTTMTLTFVDTTSKNEETYFPCMQCLEDRV